MVMSQALIGELVPPRERPRFQGYFAANFTLASIVGPVLGGLLVAHASWRWLFLINIPLIALAAWRISGLPSPNQERAGPLFEDRSGMALFALSVVLVLVWVSFAGHRFAWFSLESAVLGVMTVASGWMLLRQEAATATPYLPVELLRVPGIGAMACSVVLFAACLFSCIFFLPIYLELGAGAGADHAGLLLLPVTLGMVMGSTLTGRVVARTARPRPMPILGMSVSALALAALGLAPPSSSTVALLGFACGAGFGTVMPTAQIAIQTLAGRERLGAASAVVSLARSLGGVAGTALFGALVYGLLHGIDLEVALRDVGINRSLILTAFQHGFIAAAVLAAGSAFAASRMPALRL
jgi:MFS family permease